MFSSNSLPKTATSKKRIGRGGKWGKNATKGNKGQLKRAGKTRVGFEGGGRSLIRRTPKLRGYNFNGKSTRDMTVLSLTILDKNFEEGDNINLDVLIAKNIIDKKIKRVRIIKAGQTAKKFKFDDSIYLTKGAKEIFA